MSESPPETNPASASPRARRVRWWPAALIALAALVAVSATWLHPQLSGTAQYQSMWLQGVLVVTLILLALWFLLISGLSARARCGGALCAALALATFFTLFRVEGVTGNLRPIFAPRFFGGRGRTTEPSANRAVQLVSTPGDFPQFLGPQRNGVIDEVRLDPDWGAHPPKLIWRQPVGEAWSGFVTVGDYAVTQEQQGPDEEVVCYELPTGAAVWRYRYPAEYRTVIAGNGPRATPTIDDGRVYAMGAAGLLTCLDGSDGKKVWERDTLADASAPNREWGVSCSPLVADGRVIVSSGGADGWSLVAYDKLTGEVAWHAGDSVAAYSSPRLTSLCGVPQIVIQNERTVTGHDPTDGHVLWEHPFGGGNSICADPIVIGDDQLFLSAGYGYGCLLLKLERAEDGSLSASEAWPRNRNMKFKFTNGVHLDGYIYGMDDGVLACLELKTGKRAWKAGRYGHGQLLLVGDLLLIQAETGEVVIVRANPKKLDELAKFAVFNDKTWNTPALAGDRLLVRNHKEAACFQIPILAL